jgi:predicted transcriptional regulator
MDIESLFTEQRWNILKALSEQPLSPLQLSEKLNTTMANVSQQLKLLEAVNLVKKEKIRNREKGKPRTLFSLNGEYALLVPTTRNFAAKKLVHLTPHQKTIMRIWFLPLELQHSAEELYWKLDERHKDFAMAADEQTGKLYLITEHKDIKDAKASVISRKEASRLPLTLLHGSLVEA